METLTTYDKARYARQMMLDGWGEEGQRRIKGSTVFVAGAGGLGSPVSMYLAVAGVGTMRVCDADKIELSNLNRQILHADARIGQPKTASAQKTLTEMNPKIEIIACSNYLEKDNVAQLVGPSDIVVDCLDNFETRYVLNRYCIQQRIPLLHGGVWGLIGQATFLCPPETPCLRCIFPEAPPKETFPVVGVTPGVIGCLQAMEALKHLSGIGSTLKGEILHFDGQDMRFTRLKLGADPSCPDCGNLARDKQP